MRLGFVTVDVFTQHQFGGNPLAVVTDARGLSSGQMQAIAAEFNLAETTFVLPPREPAHTAEVRIFTPRAEMPFAGHPNVGTAFVLARQGECLGRPIVGETMIFEEKAGLVPITILRRGATVLGAELAAPRSLEIGETVAAALVAQACGLAEADIDLRRHPPLIASAGAPFLIAEMKERRVLAAARADAAIFARHLPREIVTGIHLYVHHAEHGADIHSRMFAPLHGIPEDPATGSANVALIGLLARLRPQATLRLTKRIGQGFDMGRPSLLDARAEKRDGAVTAAFIGGACVPVMRGEIDIA